MIIGSHNSQIATLVERHTRYVMLVRVPSKDTKTVIDALIKHAHKLPRELYKSLTWDRGKEMANHQRFSLGIDIKVYFCDPGSPWQRGSNENTNGLLRQYFPKGMDLSNINQNRLNAVARQLNERREKRWVLKRQLIDLTHVLRRPVESKPNRGWNHYTKSLFTGYLLRELFRGGQLKLTCGYAASILGFLCRR